MKESESERGNRAIIARQIHAARKVISARRWSSRLQSLLHQTSNESAVLLSLSLSLSRQSLSTRLSLVSFTRTDFSLTVCLSLSFRLRLLSLGE